ncbi:VOC family protein [Amycolatopsis speibonae]|uniref:VOC family protein n=1 Tax=Amycolatopsis speibonae TaxID=1450224 RepID=A0ABV7NR02_9PSEU
MMISHISTVGINVRDPDAALDFYTGKLGFEVRKKVDTPNFKWYEIAPPNAESTLVLVTEGYGVFDADRIGKYTGVSFRTESIHDLFTTYTERGVHFTCEPTLESYGQWFASFADQDGNEFFVFQPEDE